MTFPAATHQAPTTLRSHCRRFATLALITVSACGTPANSYSPGQLDDDQRYAVKRVVKAFVLSYEDYPALRDELLKDPVATKWFIRDLESRIVNVRMGQAEMLGEEKVRIDRVREATRQRNTPVEWNLPGQRADSRAIAQIIEIGEPAVDVVINDLALSPQEFLRSIGIELLTGIGDPAVPALLKLASTGEQQQQRVAARALGEIGAVGPSFDALKELARSPVWRIRSDAAKGLAKGGPAARDLLIEMLRDEDAFVRRKAGEALAQYKDRIAATALVDFLESCKTSKDWTGELAAQKALQAIAGTRGPRAAAAWRRFADEMPPGEDGR
ncbi:MAG: hypothetical protein ACI8UD_002997 [Planctomycetota bacterium]|jgi:hypothetical protein